MSLLRQLFRQKIGKYLTEDMEEIFFPFLRSEKHPPKNLLQDINLLWFTPGDYKEGGGCILECLEDSQYCHTIEDYAENYRENFECRRAMAPLRSVEYMRNEQEGYHKVGGYPAIKAAISDYPENTGVDIVNIIRRLRNGELNFDIEENDTSWSSGDIAMYSMDTTTLIIYREELAINDKWKDKIEDFLDKHMFPKCIPFNNEYGFIWLASDDSEIYGRLILKQERGMNDHFWDRAGVDDFYF
jgi:hypothetical protein